MGDNAGSSPDDGRSGSSPEADDGRTGIDAAGFFDALCRNRSGILLIVALATLFFVVQVPYLAVAEPGSAEYVLAQLNVLGSLGFALLGGTAVWFCRRRESV